MTAAHTGFVVIGRNEGQRLVRCLESMPPPANHIVYVDSGSTDGSIEMAEARGVNVVRLDTTTPFTAGRARNEGFAAVQAVMPDVAFVQFVDGDCELDARWVETAAAFLAAHPEIAVVCGRRRERFPDASIYNRLCDREWNTPVGEAAACGGDALMRARVFADAGGFNPAMIAGEEPELCSRLRTSGWTIWRIDAEMTMHDAAMLRFRQWWLRGVRSGFGYAQVNARTRRSGTPLYGRDIIRAVIWALIVPLAAIVCLAIQPLLALPIIALYPLQIIRLAVSGSAPDRWAYAALMMAAKFSEIQGILRYFWTRHRNESGAIVYK